MIKKLIYLVLLAALLIGITNKQYKITSFEFTTICKECGYHLAEGYRSFVDGYKSFYCPECKTHD